MRKRIHITGIVQGVGFRPFVYNLAMKHGLSGFCLNDSEGVIIEVEGASIDGFIRELKTSPPPLSRIEGFVVEPSLTNEKTAGFQIRESVPEAGKFVLVSPDISICEDCESELLDPSDRRYLYPFINCTNCGPRYSIITDIPYDRERTTMASFRMCQDCEREYRDPSNRRFHAQPNACSVCGPSVWITRNPGASMEPPSSVQDANFTAIKKARALLKEGAIIAIKGLGGFHLACDASNRDSVERLRQRKRRSVGRDGPGNKPFAVMAPDIETIRRFAIVSREEEEALIERTRPITLLEKNPAGLLPESVAPNNRRYGVMLPYTPLHRLLFNPRGEDGVGFTALVMTSGNVTEEPIVTSNVEALKRLSTIAEHFLLHNRPIYMRVDDSITRVEAGRKLLVRRARGFAPNPVDLGEDSANDILACGAMLKNTFCLIKGRNAIISQHVGDLENEESMRFFEETLKNLKNTFRARPSIIACDMHPDYMSTRFAGVYAGRENIPDEKVVSVQHHHAHIVSVMAEHRLKGEVIGAAFDGTGYGPDGTAWGGELLLSTKRDFVRKARLSPVPLPGSDAAIKEPWRMAVSHLVHAYGDGAQDVIKEVLKRIDPKKAEIVRRMCETGINAPLTSSAGRLFDAVSSIIGLRDSITFEGEAAIELESVADIKSARTLPPYEFSLVKGEPTEIDTRPVIRGIVEDRRRRTPPPVIAGRFHRTLSEIILSASEALRRETGIGRVALSGGVFQNSLLSGLTADTLKKAGFEVWMNEKVPSNDGGVSLGQAVIALELTKGRA